VIIYLFTIHLFIYFHARILASSAGGADKLALNFFVFLFIHLFIYIHLFGLLTRSFIYLSFIYLFLCADTRFKCRRGR